MAAPSLDALFQEAVASIDAGDLARLERQLAEHPRLVRERLSAPGAWARDVVGPGYFHDPYLLWFVAENPVRHDRLPKNIVEVAHAIVAAAKRERVPTLQHLLDYALELVATGRVPREQGAQIPLLDLLLAEGAKPSEGHGILFHRELAAYEHLLARGAPLTLAGAIATKREDDVDRLLQSADERARRIGIEAAAFFGHERAMRILLERGEAADRFCETYGPHATILHQAVWSGSLACVRAVLDAGAKLDVRDKVHGTTPLEWAEYARKDDPTRARWDDMIAYLRASS